MNPGVFTQRIFTCPACGSSITGRLSHEIEPGDAMAEIDDELRLPITVKITGLQVEHDCIPKVTR